MAKRIPSSRTQDRVLGLMGVDFDGTYSHAARLLEDAGLPGNGMVDGLDARDIKKLSDDDLLSKLPQNVAPSARTTAQVSTDVARAKRDAAGVRKQRTKTNDRLRAHGFRWTKTGADHADNIDQRDTSSLDSGDSLSSNGWILLNSDGDRVTVDAALASIR